VPTLGLGQGLTGSGSGSSLGSDGFGYTGTCEVVRRDGPPPEISLGLLVDCDCENEELDELARYSDGMDGEVNDPLLL
jgi:hypothetical protein